MYIYIYIYIGISKFEKHGTTLFGYETFFLPLSLKGLRDKEREAQSFYSGFFISAPPKKHVRNPPKSSPRACENQLSSPKAGLNSTNWLFQNRPKTSARNRCVTSFALAILPFPSWAIVTSLSDTSSLRAREHLC